MTEFSVGDFVQLYRTAEESHCWLSGMERHVGHWGPILEIEDGHALVDGCVGGYWVPLGALRKEEEDNPFSDLHSRLAGVLEVLEEVQESLVDWHSYVKLTRSISNLKDVYHALGTIPPSR